MGVEALVAQAAVEALDKGIVGWFARREKSSVIPFSYAQWSSAFEMNSGLLSTRRVLGAPRLDEIRVIAATTAVHRLPAVEGLLRNLVRRLTSATDVPVSTSFTPNAICSPVCFVFFMSQLFAREL